VRFYLLIILREAKAIAFQHLQVTEENKKEYVKLYVNYRWCRGIEQQFLALQKGFNEVIPQHMLRPFDESELELIIGEHSPAV
jgi:E3 ubiquitin ligase SMURF1/2